MEPRLILQPACALVLLTFLVGAVLFRGRIRAVKASGKNPKGLVDPAIWDEVFRPTENLSDNLIVLFEMPTLFYVASVIILVTQATDPVFLTLAWGFVFFRVVHTLIHTTYNKVLHRMLAFMAANATLLAMWVLIFARLA